MKIYKRKAKGTSLKWNSKYIDFEGTILRISSRMRAWLLVVWKRFRERERGARQRGCTLAVIQVSGRRTDKGWAWRSARAFCGGIDYSLLSRCTGRVKSTPLPASLSHLLFQRSPLYLISTLLFFLPSPRFSPHPAHFLLPHISLAASWLTCEPSWITGEQSH